MRDYVYTETKPNKKTKYSLNFALISYLVFIYKDRVPNVGYAIKNGKGNKKTAGRTPRDHKVHKVGQYRTNMHLILTQRPR